MRLAVEIEETRQGSIVAREADLAASHDEFVDEIRRRLSGVTLPEAFEALDDFVGETPGLHQSWSEAPEGTFLYVKPWLATVVTGWNEPDGEWHEVAVTEIPIP